jgi:signal transduction histidine kinase
MASATDEQPTHPASGQPSTTSSKKNRYDPDDPFHPLDRPRHPVRDRPCADFANSLSCWNHEPIATQPSVAAPNVDVQHWRAALVVGLVACVVWAALPSDGWLHDTALYATIELGAVCAVVVGVRRYRPAAPHAWLLIAAGIFAFAIGDLVWGLYEAVGGDTFRWSADALYLIGYPLIAAGLVVATRWRVPRSDWRSLIDAGMITVAASLFAWVYLIDPNRTATELGLTDKLVSSAYPVGDLILLAVAARFLLGSGWGAAALRVLAVGLLLLLVGDTLFALDVLTRLQENERFADTVLLAAMVLIGLAGFHPSMTALTEQAPDVPDETTTERVLLLVGAFLVPPVVLIVQELRGEPLFLAATATAMLLMAGLAVARLADLSAGARRAANREALLSRYAAELLESSSREELFAVAERTADELVGSGTARVVERGGEPAGRTDHAFASPVEVGGEPVAELVADTKPSRLRSVSDSLTVVATELSMALERERLLEREHEAAEALAEQNQRLRELDRMKDQFVSSVSHELRTPLTSIVGYLELVLAGETGEVTGEQRRFLEIVNRNCERLNRLVDDILFEARVDAGRLTLDLQWVDLARLAADSVETARATAESKGLDLRLSDEVDLPQLRADPLRLTQMLDNLLSNAIKFTPEGGTVSVTVASRAETAHLEISDTGVGIPEQELGELFNRFFRASTTASAPGTGLGLSIVKSIVEAHAGTISVESKEGTGTTFSVDLPLQALPEAAAAAGTSKEVAT